MKNTSKREPNKKKRERVRENIEKDVTKELISGKKEKMGKSDTEVSTSKSTASFWVKVSGKPPDQIKKEMD